MKQEKLDLKLQICKDFAIKEHEGLCLSTKYKDNKTKMLWQCKEGHQWEAIWHNIKKGSWCPHCAGLAKPTIEDLQNFAIKEHNGLCKSTKYINNNTKYEWQCEFEHQWIATWNSIKDNNSWCPYCAGNGVPTIEDLQNFAIREHNGFCKSTKYIGNHSKYLWECSEGHKWETSWSSVHNIKTWCPYCVGLGIPTIEDLQNFAFKEHEGFCRSTEYINAYSKYWWQCKDGHKWEARWDNIKSGKWCPECSTFKSEKLCRELLELKLNYKFEKTRFYFDIDNTHKYLEFDGYNQEHHIAFEYHGRQHYEFPNHCHKTEKEFLDAQMRDDYKEQFAAENDIRLIIIPYTEANNLEEYIDNLTIQGE